MVNCSGLGADLKSYTDTEYSQLLQGQSLPVASQRMSSITMGY